MSTPGLDQVAQTQTAIERSPLAFVAALFALLFVWLLAVHLRSRDRAFRDLMQMAIKVETALASLAAYVDTLPKPRHARKTRKPGVEDTGSFRAPAAVPEAAHVDKPPDDP